MPNRLLWEHWKISIHALREEGDAPTLLSKKSLLYFYPRPPRGGRHYIKWDERTGPTISIHALREEGDAPAMWYRFSLTISIHALREEGDE